MRKHIAKALQARSKAVRKALERYNRAAAKLRPPRRHLVWEEIVEYAFISEFDLLRDSRNDPRRHLWSTPEGRQAFTLHQRIQRAREEIARLDIEVRRVATHLHDEEQYLQGKEDEARRADDGVLAHHIKEYRLVRGLFTDYHHNRLLAITTLPGSTASVTAGRAVSPYSADDPCPGLAALVLQVVHDESLPAASTASTVELTTPTYPDNDNGSDYEGGTEDDDEVVGSQVERVINLADDNDADNLQVGPEAGDEDGDGEADNNPIHT